MRIDVISIFPALFGPFLATGILNRAQVSGLMQIVVHDLRDYTVDRHRVVDDYPYGGGGGMVMKPQPLVQAIEAVREVDGPGWVILLSPQGGRLQQQKAKLLAQRAHLVLICGRYEGVDERVRSDFVHEELSIGDYVLMGGELPAMVLVEAVARMIPGVVGSEESVRQDSFYEVLLDFPHYTRPVEFRGMRVPPVLLSGNPREIQRWRRREAIRRTYLRRPDLLAAAQLTEEELDYLRELKGETPELTRGR